MRLLDLFCGAGGAAVGYHRAGFEDITGVDNMPMPRYPFEFVQGDALEYVIEHGAEYDVIHASPPCQKFSSMNTLWNRDYPDLIAKTRDLLEHIGRPYIIENVPSAPLNGHLMLCGTMFGLRVIRHRYFECKPPLAFAPASCNHWQPVVKCGHKPDRENEFHSVIGHFSDVDYGRMAMGIDWMVQGELAEAIPPAYTEFIGRRIMEGLDAA